MTQSQYLREAETLAERPVCPHCLERMWLTRVEPERQDHERRIFECPVCAQSDVKIVRFRLSSVGE
jgi:hypothetical protein